MTREKSFKRRVRATMAATGTRYTEARARLVQKRERVKAARARLADVSDRPADEKVKAATGRSWEAWFTALDAWGARTRTHRDTAAHLMRERDVPGWWAQTITVWYQRSRGLRLKHQQAHGFTVSASKTIAVAPDVAFDAFVNAATRRRWLDGTMQLRGSQPGRLARFAWGDGATRVVTSFEGKGPGKTLVAIAHERLPDADEAQTEKLAWRQRLARLKTLLEA